VFIDQRRVDPQPADFSLKNFYFNARGCAITLLAVFSASHAFAQTSQSATRPDKIMAIAELRTCFKLKASNEASAASILQEQESFKRDEDAVKSEQAEVARASDALRARSAALATERDAMAALVPQLSAQAEAAKTDAEKAAYDAERAKLVERNAAHQKNVESFNAAQQPLLERVNAVNARVVAINARGKTINDRVEPQQKQVATWKEQCGSRRYREEDEIVVKKEMAAGK
jgi:hypothetical protein